MEADQSRNSEGAEKGATDEVAVDLEADLPTIGDDCKNAEHWDLACAEQGRNMDHGEVRWTQEREGGFHFPVLDVEKGERGVVFEKCFDFLTSEDFQAFAQPGNHEHGIRR